MKPRKYHPVNLDLAELRYLVTTVSLEEGSVLLSPPGLERLYGKLALAELALLRLREKP